MFSIELIPEDLLDAWIHARVFGSYDEAPPYSTHDPSAARVVERLRELEWIVDLRQDPDTWVVEVHRGTEGSDRITASAPTFAEAVCLAAKQVIERKEWGMKMDVMLPIEIDV
jgi:hypothetical protein